MPIEKVLFPTDFNELSYQSLESLFVLRNAGLKEVVLCNVILREDVGFVPYGGYLKEEDERLRGEARIRFEDWQSSLTSKGIKSKIEIHVGDPVHEILITAEKEKADLIFIGKRRSLGKDKSFIGPHAQKIITRSKFPVLVSSHAVQFKWDEAELTRENDLMFEMPMVVVDWSDLSKRVVDFVSSFKGVTKKVLLFHNVDKKDPESGKQCFMDTKVCEDKLAVYCDLLNAAGINAEPHIGAGSLFNEVLRVSREREASMIIMGNTSGHRFFEKMLHRSTSYEIARLSELPIMLIP